MVVTRFLLEHDADAKPQDLDKLTLLHVASGYGHVGMLGFFLIMALI